mgnify:CR=1 FL=1
MSNFVVGGELKLRTLLFNMKRLRAEWRTTLLKRQNDDICDIITLETDVLNALKSKLGKRSNRIRRQKLHAKCKFRPRPLRSTTYEVLEPSQTKATVRAEDRHQR